MGARQRTRGGSRRAAVARGEVRWLELEQEGRRPVVVLTRDEALPGLRNVVVALVARTARGIPAEVPVLSPRPLDAHLTACTANVGVRVLPDKPTGGFRQGAGDAVTI